MIHPVASPLMRSQLSVIVCQELPSLTGVATTVRFPHMSPERQVQFFYCPTTFMNMNMSSLRKFSCKPFTHPDSIKSNYWKPLSCANIRQVINTF